MKHHLIFCAFLTCFLPTNAQTSATSDEARQDFQTVERADEGNNVKAYFKEGKLHFATRNKKFHLWFDNRVNLESAVYSPTKDVDNLTSKTNKDLENDDTKFRFSNGTIVRRARLGIKAEENGKALTIERVSGYDPLHILAYEVPCVRAGIKPKFETKKTTNLFKIKASDATSTIDITVTDGFGNTCVEHMKRPKPFSLNSYTTTGIQATGTAKMHCCQLSNKIYNLAGMPMERPFRGIYVSKGKKVLF